MLIRRLPGAGLASLFEFATQGVAEALLPQACRPALAAGFSLLPPYARCGLELRLAAGQPLVDAHQHLMGADAWRALSPCLPGLAQPEAASLLDALLSDLIASRCESLRGVGGLWLELDSNRPRQPLAPVVFLDLPATAPAPQVLALAGRLSPQAPGAQLDALAGLLDSSAAAGARASHFGAMLGRPGVPWRVNLSGVQHEALAGLLRACGWPGPVAALHGCLDRLRDLPVLVVLAVDVAGSGVLPRLGLELFPVDPSPRSTDAADLLDALQRWALCEPAKAAAIRDWPVDLVPDRFDWPDWLMLEQLLEHRDSLLLPRRLFRHAKLQIEADGSLAAKAYLGFGLIQMEST